MGGLSILKASLGRLLHQRGPCVLRAWLCRFQYHEVSLHLQGMDEKALAPCGVSMSSGRGWGDSGAMGCLVFSGCGWAGCHTMRCLCILRAWLGRVSHTGGWSLHPQGVSGQSLRPLGRGLHSQGVPGQAVVAPSGASVSSGMFVQAISPWGVSASSGVSKKALAP